MNHEEWLSQAQRDLLEMEPHDALRSAHQLLKFAQTVEAECAGFSRDAEFAAERGPGMMISW